MTVTKAFKERGYRRGSYLYHIKDGLYFHKNRILRDGRVSLRCVKWKERRCPGRAVMDANRENFHHSYQDHNHQPDPKFISVRNLRSKILDRCKQNDPTSNAEIVLEEGIRGRFPRLVRVRCAVGRLRSSMRRARLSNYPKIPKNLSSLAKTLRDPLYRHLCVTLDDQDFIYGGSCGKTADKTRCVLFMSRRFRRLMTLLKIVHMDGTWDARPACPKCSQLFCIVANIDHQMLPLCVVMMESRSELAYDTLFTKLKMLCPGFDPTRIICDFETALQNSCASAWPGVDVQGCYFHYAKDILLHAKKKLKLTRFIRRDMNVESLVRSCCAIPLLPTERLDEGLAAIIVSASRQGYMDILGPFFLYIRQEWLDKKRNVLSVCDVEDRTNNCCETFHWFFISLMGRRRSSLWKFLSTYKKVEEMAYQDWYSMCVDGATSRRLRKASAIYNDANIKNLSRRLEDGHIDISSFLRRASRRVQNVFDNVFPLQVQNH